MRSLIIVIVKIFIETVFSRIKVNMFTFKSLEKPFNVKIVNRSSFAIHTDSDGWLIEKVNPFFASTLASLIGINNPGFSKLQNRSFNHFQDRISFQRVG